MLSSCSFDLSAMKPQEQLASFVFIPLLFVWVDCANVPACASMKSWFPGTFPLSFADNLPYELSVTGYVPDGESIPRYTPESSHIGKIGKLNMITKSTEIK